MGDLTCHVLGARSGRRPGAGNASRVAWAPPSPGGDSGGLRLPGWDSGMTLGKWRREGRRGLWRKKSLRVAAAGGVSGTLQLEREPRAGGWQRAVTARSAPSLRLTPASQGLGKAPGSGPPAAWMGKEGPWGPQTLPGSSHESRRTGRECWFSIQGPPGQSLPWPSRGQTRLLGPPPRNQYLSRLFSSSTTRDAPLSSGSPGQPRGGQRWPEAPIPQKPRAVLPAPRWGGGDHRRDTLAYPQSPPEVTWNEGDGKIFRHSVWGPRTPGEGTAGRWSGEQAAGAVSPWATRAVLPPNARFPGLGTWPIPAGVWAQTAVLFKKLALRNIPEGMSLTCSGSR